MTLAALRRLLADAGPNGSVSVAAVEEALRCDPDADLPTSPDMRRAWSRTTLVSTYRPEFAYEKGAQNAYEFVRKWLIGSNPDLATRIPCGWQ